MFGSYIDWLPALVAIRHYRQHKPESYESTSKKEPRDDARGYSLECQNYYCCIFGLLAGVSFELFL